MQLQQNTLFDNRYTLRTLIGRGGFSEVWLAHDTWTDLDIAIKVYAPGQGMDTNGLQIFSKELACVFNLNHPNLLKPTHVGQWLNMPYLIMEYCPKGALNKQVGKLTEQEIWKVLHDVAAGLAYLHSKEIVHQDIKPDNILRDDTGDYRITDFGISTKARTTLRRSIGGASVSGGTTAYMAPERFSANPAPTKASDVWSLGAMVYELITGDVPFGEIGGGLQKNGAEIPTIEPIIGTISPTLTHVVRQMLAPNAWDRPTAETLATWAANPAVLHFSGAADAPKTATDRPTTPLSVERDTVIFEQHTPHTTPHTPTPPKKSSKAWIWFLVLLIVLIIGIPFGIKIYNDYQWEKTYTKSLTTDHRYAVSEFDEQIQNATIDNIASLENAAKTLTSIKEYEDDPKYEGTKVYDEKRSALRTKAKDLYDKAYDKYRKAPYGSSPEKIAKEKYEKIDEIRQKI